MSHQPAGATAQQWFTRGAVSFIVGAALVLTYDGTMRFCQAHGAHGWRGSVIALMNDLAVLVGILWPERQFQFIASLCAGFTIWANVAHAGPGGAGVAVALIPPGLAILMVGALEMVAHRSGSAAQVSHSEPAHEPPSEPLRLAHHEPETGSSEPAHEPLFAAHLSHSELAHEPPSEPVSRPRVNRSKRLTGGSSSTSQAAGSAWAMSQWESGSAWPTVVDILAQFPEMSRATAKRVRAQNPAGTAGTADRGSGDD